MASGGMAYDGCPNMVEAWIVRHFLENVASCETDVLESSRPTATRVADSPVLYVACDYSLGGEGGAEMADMRQVIASLPETAVDNEEQRERSFAFRKSKLSELSRVIAVIQP
jgi:hypothetical protein